MNKNIKYIGAAITVFLLLLNQLLIQYSLNEQQADFTCLTDIGRQRMLSQQVSVSFYRLSLGTENIQNVEELVSKWKISLHSHVLACLKREKSILYPAKLKAANTELSALDARINFIENKLVEYKNTHQFDVEQIVQNQNEFTYKIEELIPVFSDIIQVKTTRLVLLEIFLAICTFLVIFLELRYIYYPQAKKLKKSLAEIKIQEQALEKSKSLYNALESLNDYSFYLLDAQGIVQTWNPGVQKIKGYTAEEMIGKDFRLFYTEIDVENGKPDKLLTVAARDGAVQNEGWRIRKDGSVFWAKVVVTAIYDKDKNVTGYSKLTGDITSYKIASSAANKVQSLLSYWDVNLKCRFANKSYSSWFNKDPEELIDKIRLPELWGQRYERIENRVNAVLKGEPQNFELEVTHPVTGDNTFFLANYYPDIEDGIVKGFIIQVNDITHLKQLEDERLQRTKLEAKNSELENFAYIASHDLQEPLRTISNYLQIIRTDHIYQLTEKVIGYLGSVEGATARMRELVKVLLDYARLGKGQTPVFCNTQKIVEAVLFDLDSLITSTHATVHFEVLPVVWGYETELRQLFQNLLTNAIKFRNPNLPPAITILCRETKRKFEFSVIDNGIGIEEKHYQKIFQIFQRLHNTSKYPGNGIGLANCLKIVEMHGGKIWVKSEVGKGSVFTFALQKFKLQQDGQEG